MPLTSPSTLETPSEHVSMTDAQRSYFYQLNHPKESQESSAVPRFTLTTDQKHAMAATVAQKVGTFTKPHHFSQNEPAIHFDASHHTVHIVFRFLEDEITPSSSNPTEVEPGDSLFQDCSSVWKVDVESGEFQLNTARADSHRNYRRNADRFEVRTALTLPSYE